MLCTNPIRIKKAIEDKAVNALLLKINQIGTITEAIEVILLQAAVAADVVSRGILV